MSKTKLKIIIGLVICIIFTVIVALIVIMPVVSFKQSLISTEINEKFDPVDNISGVRSGDIKDVKIDASKVNTKKLGTYPITYTYAKHFNEKHRLKVKVVDSIPPQFDVVNNYIGYSRSIKASDLVKNIKDATKTKTYFAKKYHFKKEGNYKVKVVVEDEGHNKTIKSVMIKIAKDDQPPTIQGALPVSLVVGTPFDYKTGVSVIDDHDPNPTLSIDSSKVNLNAEGSYEAIYTAVDKAGNVAKLARKIIIYKSEIGIANPSGQKIVYLTFDDGPSYNTPKILAVLNTYHVKATFFVTGMHQGDNQYIKQAAAAGHTIGLHTYTHNYAYVYSSVDNYFKDLDQIGTMVKNLIGYRPHYIRFPGGSSNTVSANYSKGIMSALVGLVQEKGYQYYDWNASSGDASGNNIAVSQIVAQATSNRGNNIVMLMHDGVSKDTTVLALPRIIEYYQSQGYIFSGINDNSYRAHHGVAN